MSLKTLGDPSRIRTCDLPLRRRCYRIEIIQASYRRCGKRLISRGRNGPQFTVPGDAP